MAIAKPMGSSNKRVRIVYAIATVETSLLILLIFMQPVYTRLVGGIWDRYGSLLKWTLSLDVHVLFAIPFLLLLILQFILGFIQKPGQVSNRIHRRLGLFILLYTPVFLAITIWNVSVRVPYLLLQLTFYFVIIYIVFFLIRGYRAIKNKDYLKHMDSMLGAFVLSGIAATARLVYPLYILIYGHIPISAIWLISTAIFLYTKLFLIYALAGRLKQNILVWLMQAVPIFLIYVVLPWPPN
ncbi:DUF2306 domain-containing protein [Legionella maioricensis]|uniref:DUF2306 domain-containing protein n=1 Tax=Legionella maioricensis TaxID=2896528 RepID=A0A9X2IDL2_9GAMM|nr:DUF2306 domain-containing protein [Legionella maioricensis]MCL9685642.1 DUF2306 domain-containing protein [Legionella maioricensis]MCL9689051.1 DUF2306 domain-containing protein [Legionella maioricensis]